MKLAGRRVLVVGLGRSGRAAARLAHRHGARVALSDNRDAPALRQVVDDLAPLLELYELGGHSAKLFDWAETIVASPGAPLAQPIFARARANGVEILGEVELAYRLLNAPLIGITGTKGKSTTTALTGEMLRAAGQRAFVGGNLGTPLAEALLTDEAIDVAVVELSSFQLETIVDLRPRVAALLNFAPDHQDRYGSFEEYVQAKLQLFANQTADDAAVLNAADPLVMGRRGAVKARALTFGRRGADAWIDGDALSLQGERLSLTRWSPPGAHNRENLMASALLARLAGADVAAIQRAIDDFKGLAHRLEPVGELGGVQFVNDSKATTPGAVRTSLAAMTRPVVLILGGRDKGGDWTTIADAVGRTRAAFAYGEAAEKIAAGLAPLPVRVVGPFAEALAQARAAARPGDAVLLSPGCASFDQFANFEERGEAMRRWVSEQ